MRLTVFNGSPRGEKSNTKILMDHFIRGFTDNNENTLDIAFLNKTKDTNLHVEKFRRAENVILAFPLYTDAMPGIVKYFIEALKPLCGQQGNPGLGFVVQSGFPEPIHSRYVARYLEKLAKRLGCTHTGTVIRGGVEGIRVQPGWMTKKLFSYFYQLGVAYANNGSFDTEIIQKLAPRERMSLTRKILFHLLRITGVANMNWNMNLKKNNSFKKRFAHPYKEF